MNVKSISSSFIVALGIFLGLSSCKEEKLGNVEKISGLGGDEVAQTTVDKWIFDSLTTPYNISVTYRWDQFQFSDITKTLIPPKEELIIPFSKMVRQAWVTPYVSQAGLPFFNKYSPKFFVLSGSVQYLDNGSVVLGQAEGGRKIVVLDINRFRTRGMDGYVAARDSANVKENVHTLQHEFGHILHQNIMYPVEFKTVSAGLYQGANWINVTDNEAHRDGFVSAYASSGYDDDFVETIARLLVEGKDGYTRMVNSVPDGTSANGTSKADAQAKLRRKEALVVNYYKTAWGIDFYSLQAKCRAALLKLI